ncbi:MAG: imidazole glycerol phosphate synthase subunit HisH [Cyanobacteria bacterium P01_E01_bin.42]
MKKVAIVNYDAGNLDSVARAVIECGGKPEISCNPDTFARADFIILPGVGSFARGMQKIRDRNLDVILREQVIDCGIPFLGICLGMQLLATRGREGGETPGLGWIEGRVERFQPTGLDVRIPHVGWNEAIYQHSSPLLRNIPPRKDFYFVHSYHFLCDRAEDILAYTPYCGNFVSIVSRDNIFGVQFHPEKSQKVGLQLLRNFLAL